MMEWHERKSFSNVASAAGLILSCFVLLIPALTHAQAPASAQAAVKTPRAADGHPDLTGLWGTGNNFVLNREGNRNLASLGNRSRPYDPKDPDQIQARLAGRDNLERLNAPNQPPYKPELMSKVRELEEGQNQLDPAFVCNPSGVPRMGPPRQIVQGPGLVVFLYTSENGAPYRVIYTDGRKHRTDVDPSYMGDSIGHWEGDTLVVDVVKFNEDTWLGTDGWFHSGKMHVIERFTRTGNTLTYRVTVEDPEVFTRPWEMNPRTLQLDDIKDPENAMVEEGRCVDVDRPHMVSHEHL
jgi:hypothetical protein